MQCKFGVYLAGSVGVMQHMPLMLLSVVFSFESRNKTILIDPYLTSF